MKITPADVERLAQLAIVTPTLGIEHLDKLFAGPHDVPNYYRLAYLLTREFQPARVLEIGTLNSSCTAHFAAGNAQTQVDTLDISDCYNTTIAQLYPNIRYIISNSIDPGIVATFPAHSLDIIFVDGSHQIDVVLHEIQLWSPKMKPGGLWLFDDGWMMPDLYGKLPFAVKGRLPGAHMCWDPEFGGPEDAWILKDVLMAYALQEA